jgi:acyl-coenzyme A synthetase/AMP-(fatty) acid ligase
MRSIYGLNPDDVWWSASDLGWVVGHSYIAYGPLLFGEYFSILNLMTFFQKKV